MLSRIEDGVRRERSFVADASHELRAPLALLRTEVDVALDRPRNDELQAALHSVGEEVDRLSRLAEDLLLLARLDEGRLALRPELVELDELFAVVARRFGRRSAEAGRQIETDGGELAAEVDAARVEQALGNLVDNALRHGAGRLRISAAHAADGLELRVSDEGTGSHGGSTVVNARAEVPIRLVVAVEPTASSTRGQLSCRPPAPDQAGRAITARRT